MPVAEAGISNYLPVYEGAQHPRAKAPGLFRFRTS